MYQSQSFRSKFPFIPREIKFTIALTLILTFFSLLSNALFTQVLKIPGPQLFLSLSTWGVHKFFIWQFLSYLFVQPIEGGISLPLLLRIFFDLYLLWILGSSIVQIKGKKHFYALYFGGGAFIGLITYLSLLALGSSTPFAGAALSINILMIAWAFLFPETRIFLFMMIPIKAKWLAFGFIGINLFLSFANGEFFSFFVTGSALFYGYFYSVLVWEMLSPFPRMHAFEKKLIYLKRKQLSTEKHEGKVYDFRTGRVIVQDDEFMDRCLEKIARYGKQSLSWRERWKMRRISKKNQANFR